MAVDADLSTDNGKVRLNIGDVTLPYLVDDDIINAYLAMYPAPTYSEGIRIYNATIGTLRYLKANFAQTAARMREREGGVEVEVYGNEKYDAICDLLNWFENNPPSQLGIPVAMPIIGGTTKSERDTVECDSETRSNRPSLNWFDRDRMNSPESFRELGEDYWTYRD